LGSLEYVVSGFSRTKRGGHTLLHITPQERTALQRLAGQESHCRTAATLGLTERELDDLFVTLFGKMGVRTEAAAVAAAFERGLVDVEIERFEPALV
jgi:hypothetical protein